MNDKNIKGRWHDIENISKKIINSKYDKIKDWQMDPKGYFLISIDKKKKIIKTGYCKIYIKNKKQIHKLTHEIHGVNALEIINTIINKKFISSMQHAADMGIELCKAELALKHNLNYTQDLDLKINKK